MADRKFLYFGYGSNMLKERLLADQQNVYKKFIRAAKLPDYKFTFDRVWPLPGDWHGACATIRENKGSETWGAVWELDTKDKDALLSQESYLVPKEITVYDKDGKSYNCRVVEMGRSDHPGEAPSPQYKDIVVRGAKQSELPEHYIQYLEQFVTNGYKGPHELYERVLASLEK